MPHEGADEGPFSWGWVWISIALFVGAELVLGGLIGQLVVGRYVSEGLRARVQGLLILASYFSGGVLIGLISPRVRLWEPAIGGALSVGLTLVFTWFTPLSFVHYSGGRLLLGSAIAFVLALLGARAGERLMGNI